MSLGAVAGMVAGKIGELLIEEAKLLYDVADEVTSLKDELMMMGAFLQDMDEEGSDERSRVIIKQIRNLAYDAEDLIESYIFEVRKGFTERCVCFYGSISRTHTLASKIKATKLRIVESMNRWERYLGGNGVRKEGRDQGLSIIRRKAPIAYPHNIEEHVVGLEEDICKLVGNLTADRTQIDGVSIVGMGGSGKTTLARKLYNHKSIKNHFDCIAWASISQEWAASEILLELLRDAGDKTKELDKAGLPEILERLRIHLESKKCLIFLDDVWEKQALLDILPAFPSANACRKIIITTRKREVVDFPDLKCINHEPRCLNEDESWELFRKIALSHREESSNSTNMALLETLGKEMLRKCEGLPLAVIALAGILRRKQTIEEWERVKKAVSSEIMKEGCGTHLYGQVNKMLALSYDDLPNELQLCFLYLVNFPEDQDIKVNQLIRMWIAEGFIMYDELYEGYDTLEDVARGYLDELIDRCVVQIARKRHDGKVSRIRIHDLVRDLCIKKAKQQDFGEIFTSKALNANARVRKSRRIAIYYHDGEFPVNSPSLRSLLWCSLWPFYPQRLGLQLKQENFRLLRVLQLENVDCSTSSEAIGSLIHLRYLRLYDTKISQLPSSIGNLGYLQTLDCRTGGVRIPNVLWKFEGLRHLHLHGNVHFKGKLQLHTLKSLQTLTVKSGSWLVKELPLLSQSVQQLKIFGLTREKQIQAAFQCPSIKFDRLHSLTLNWNEGDPPVLKKLEPDQPIIHCQHLRKLSLWGRIGDGCDIQFPNCITKLTLGHLGFKTEVKLAALGKLPGLIHLVLWVSYAGTKWTCFAGDFPQLKELRLSALPNLEEWSIERGAMPHLNKLLVQRCPKLRKLPEGLKFIIGLQEFTLGDVSDELNKRVKEGVDGNGGGEDAHIIQHVPKFVLSRQSFVFPTGDIGIHAPEQATPTSCVLKSQMQEE